MNPKAFVILPESNASIETIATFPHDTEFAVLPDDAFYDMVARARKLGEGSKTLHIPEDPTKSVVKEERLLSDEATDSLDAELDDLTGDIGISDGC